MVLSPLLHINHNKMQCYDALRDFDIELTGLYFFFSMCTQSLSSWSMILRVRKIGLINNCLEIILHAVNWVLCQAELVFLCSVGGNLQRTRGLTCVQLFSIAGFHKSDFVHTSSEIIFGVQTRNATIIKKGELIQNVYK